MSNLTMPSKKIGKINIIEDVKKNNDIDDDNMPDFINDTPIIYNGYKILNIFEKLIKTEYDDEGNVTHTYEPYVNLREYNTDKKKTMKFNKASDLHLWDKENSKSAFYGYVNRDVSKAKFYIHNFDEYMQNSINKIGKNIRDKMYKIDDDGNKKFIGGQKVILSYHANFYRYVDAEHEIIKYADFWFNSTNKKFLNDKDITVENITEMIDEIREEVNDFVSLGSGWIFDKNIEIQVHTIRYKPMKGKSYLPLPQWILNKKKAGIINIQNDDDKCFLYSSKAYFDMPKKNPQRVSYYKNNEIYKFDFGKLQFPIECSQKTIKYLEKINPKIAWNIFSFDDEKQDFYTVIETDKNAEHTINLLFWNIENVGHYALIKNLNALTYSKNNAHHVKHMCNTCLRGFSSEEILKYHRDVLGCSKFGQAVIMPGEKKKKDDNEEQDEEEEKNNDTIYKFRRNYRKFKCPFIFYCDFESITERIDEDNKYQAHKACSYQIYRVSTDPKYNKLYPVVKNSDNKKLIAQYLNDIIEYGDEAKGIINNNVPIIMTKQDEKIYRYAKNCYLCDKLIEKGDKVKDHDHLTGKFRGAACNKCNLAEKKRDIPVVFHNLSGYDSHLIMENFRLKDIKVSCIAQTAEKYIGFTIGKLRFIDSIRFLSSSLENLVYSLVDAPKDKSGDYKDYETLNDEEKGKLLSNIKINCHHTLTHLDIANNTEKILLLLQKGVYPYDYMNDFNKFNDTSLPPKHEFYSLLNKQDISDEDYARAQKVWKTFNLKTMGDYHDLYLNTDILLLADVFENFRTLSMNEYKLDPAHYYTSPGLAMDAALLKSDQKIDLFTDYEMYLMTEKGIRGGISSMMKRYAIANNKYITIETTLNELKKTDIDTSKVFVKDPNQKQSFIIYLDANNLYGWAMNQHLPTGNYQWVNTLEFYTDGKINVNKIMNLQDEANTGYMFDVDLEYPKELHDLHNDYPLAPESYEVTYNMISEYNKNKLQQLNKKFTPCKKLVPNLHNKSNYVVHYRNLKLYLSLGMKITKINKIISFNQSKWLSDYIISNTNMRAKSKSDFKKDFYKLMNNAVFGKTMENVRNHVNYALINDENKIAFQVNKPLYSKPADIFNDEFIGLSSKNHIVKLDKPIAVGFAILELSKVLMYDFHYNTIKNKYNDKAKLLMTDTDSLVYEIETEDVYKDFEPIKDKFDTANFPKDHPLYNIENDKKIGKFKFETGFNQIKEFVGLRAKMYSFIVNKNSCDKDKKIAKGIKKQCVNQDITFEHYKKCLFSELREDMQQKASFNVIRSKLHKLYSETVNKIGLVCTDDKRYILEDGITSYAYGHKNIPK